VGFCWPNDSTWVDFINPEARTWYASLFRYDVMPHAAPNVWIWNDMNEPAIFDR
jgi:alpha 1,3-glucosidase